MHVFISQIKRILKIKQYKYAALFVIHYSRYTYTHLKKTFMADETKEKKTSFEGMCRHYDFQVEAFHDENGIFIDNK